MGLDLGVGLPSGRYASPEAIVSIAREAERLGFSALWCFERVLRPLKPKTPPPGGYLPETYSNVYDPIDTLSYVAAKTERIKLGTSIIDAFFHPPVILARRFATLDQLSGGRVIAGLGQGWSEEEFETVGVPMKRRGRGMEEYVAALRAVWGPDPVSFNGRIYKIPESQIGPKPVQRGGPPIIIAAFAPPAIERAAKIADGLNPGAWGSLENLEQTVTLFRNTAKAAGRDPDRLQMIVRANAQFTRKPIEQSRQPFSGSIEQIIKDIQYSEQLHVNHIFFDLNFATKPIDEQIEFFRQLRERI